MKELYERHVCRTLPMPGEMTRTPWAVGDDPTIHFTMNGPSEFQVMRTLKNLSVIAQLRLIDVPLLLVYGRYDRVTPEMVQPFAVDILDMRWMIFGQSSRMPISRRRRPARRRSPCFRTHRTHAVEGEHRHVA